MTPTPTNLIQVGLVRGEANGLRILRTAVEHATDKAARPLDFMENLHPALWLRDGDRPALAVINWADIPKEIALPSAECSRQGLDLQHGREVWNNRPLRQQNETFSITLPPHDAAWFIS
ncbi:MAG: hypothetical protein HY360_15285 [Verrucomicrobia bacterium]|nr:hypothetical protein [Verrucomicrobiota bacterium]